MPYSRFLKDLNSHAQPLVIALLPDKPLKSCTVRWFSGRAGGELWRKGWVVGLNYFGKLGWALFLFDLKCFFPFFWSEFFLKKIFQFFLDSVMGRKRKFKLGNDCIGMKTNHFSSLFISLPLCCSWSFTWFKF